MPYRITIPDTCDRYGCCIKEAAQLIAYATSKPEDMILLPSPLKREEIYTSKEGEILAEAKWYETIRHTPKEEDETNS